LVARQIRRTSRDSIEPRDQQIFANTRAVLFLATPHAGAGLASLASSFRKVFGTTVAVEDLHEHDTHRRELLDWYRNYAAQRRSHEGQHRPATIRCRGAAPNLPRRRTTL
jgi:hypothetical protein